MAYVTVDTPERYEGTHSESVSIEIKDPESPMARIKQGQHQLIIRLSPDRSVSFFLSTSDLNQLVDVGIQRLYEIGDLFS